MEATMTFLSAFLLVFIGELGDKTQIATGTGALANRNRTSVVFLSSTAALTAVAGLTVFFASLIPAAWNPSIENVGGSLLIGYGLWLFFTANNAGDGASTENANRGWKLFLSHFVVVFVAELGDKTQFATLAVAIENEHRLLLVFTAATAALVAVTGLTVWGVTRLPVHWTKDIQRVGALLMSTYGLYMVVS